MISIIIPAHNEEENIRPLCERIKSAMDGAVYEIVLVDDGSTDNTLEEMKGCAAPEITTLALGRRMGKCAAIYNGLRNSSGGMIALIDADMQNDPSDILRMSKEIGPDCDMVCGWRKHRKDGPVKRLSSRVGNTVSNIVLGVRLHDNNSSLKVFRRECTERVRYFRNMHGFLPAMAVAQGYRVKEIEVRHYPRIHGKTKYGISNRIAGNLKALMIARFRQREIVI